jgi:hypothetical protein
VTLRNVKGKLRVEAPRLKDNTLAVTARDPSVGRDALGRAVAGNTLATGRGWKATIRKALGADASDEAVRSVLTLYLAILRGLPADGATVRQLAAAQARHAWLATEYTNAARTAGLTTPEGLKLAEASRSHDLASQRIAVTAFDLATREAQTTTEDDAPGWTVNQKPKESKR